MRVYYYDTVCVLLRQDAEYFMYTYVVLIAILYFIAKVMCKVTLLYMINFQNVLLFSLQFKFRFI